MSLLDFNSAKPLDFIGLGRLCIDLNSNEINQPMERTSTFTRYLGGSPANITVALARLGLKTGFIGRVAADPFGRFIADYLRRNAIDAGGVVVDKSGSVTGLAFTEIKSPTDCSILMYRDNVADLKLECGDIDREYIQSSKCLLISGTALAKSPSREAALLAIEYARQGDVRLIFDLDYRPYSWGSAAETAFYYYLAAQKCDVILGTLEEYQFMEGLLRLAEWRDARIAEHFLQANAQIVVIKHGKEGSAAFLKNGATFQAPSFRVKVLKTFGAGDSYAGALIYGLLQDWAIDQCLTYASAAAAIVVSSHSCSEAMPTEAQIADFIAHYAAAPGGAFSMPSGNGRESPTD